MLVAGTAMSLIAPIAAQASDSLNHDGMNSYVRSERNSKRIDSKTFVNQVNELATVEESVDALQAQQYDFEAGSFSDTTTLDGKAVMWIGAIDGADEMDADGNPQGVQTGYTYTMNLNTSFTGDDNLYVRLKGGDNGDTWGNKQTYHIETKNTDDAGNTEFRIDKIWYSWNVTDEVTAFVGPRIENYYMYITPSIYQPGVLKSMKLGGNSNFGASTDIGYGFKYENESGFGIASNIVTKDADTEDGMLGKNDQNKWDTQIAYTTDNWHVSATLSDAQGWTSHSYNATTRAVNMSGDGDDTTGYALRAYWRPDNSGTRTPEVSLGYDIKTLDDASGAVSEKADSYFVGLTWRDMFQADDRIGVAFTQPLRVTEMADGSDTGEVDPFVWEAYYSFRPNDSIEIRPAVFGGSDVLNDTEDDILGFALTSVFKF